MKTKLFTLLFAIAVGTGAVLAEEINGICYYINYSAGFAGVTYGKNYSGNVTIPDKISYKGKVLSVVAIGENAFKNCTNLTSVTIPNSVEVIYDYAFSGCSGLTNLTIPNSVARINQYAFSGCTGLINLTIPNNVYSIGPHAFSGILNVNYSGSASGSPWGAFFANCYVEGCLVYSNAYKTNLLYCSKAATGEIIVPNSVTSIESGVFSGCSNITSVTIPNSVTSIGGTAFSGCSKLTSVTLNSDAIINKTFTSKSNLRSIFGSQVEEYNIGEAVSAIGKNAFSNSSSLKSVTLGNSITCINDSAFAGCNSLTSISIPNSVTYIGGSAFYGCSSLTSVTIPNSVKYIRAETFYGCSGLTSVTIPTSIIEIGENAFYNCSRLPSVTIGNRVTDIGSSAFAGCSGLTSVTIGNRVTDIGSSAFAGCSGLTKVYITNLAAWCNISFKNRSSNPLIYAKHLFLNDKELIDVTIPNGSSIKNYVFSGCSSLTSINLPNNITSIGDEAFYNCSKLTSIVIPNGVTSIGESTFYGCRSLTSVTIPYSLEKLGKNVFSYCTSLDTVIWNAKSFLNVSISGGTGSVVDVNLPFDNCRQISTFIFGEGVEYIPCGLCSNLTKLQSIVIPNSVKTIACNAFEYCTGVKSITIGENVTSFNRYIATYHYGHPAFFECRPDTVIWNAIDCPSFTNDYVTYYQLKPQKCLYIGNKVKRIPAYCFAYSGISTVTIPKSVTHIGENAFYYSSNLESVYMENPTPSGLFVDPPIFDGTSSALKIYVPCGSANAYKNAHWASLYTSLIQYPAATAKVVSANKQEGDVSAITICDTKITATAKYGYHFTQWSDGNKDNPRYIDPTEDVTYVAEFAPNQYTITLNCDAEQGKVEGAGTFDYLTNIKISATPNEGYLFVMWSDYNMSDTRTIKVEKDLSLTAIFVSDLNALNDVKSNNTLPRKVMKDGQLFILRDGKTYTVQGQEVR